MAHERALIFLNSIALFWSLKNYTFVVSFLGSPLFPFGLCHLLSGYPLHRLLQREGFITLEILLGRLVAPWPNRTAYRAWLTLFKIDDRLFIVTLVGCLTISSE
jgi:hypothetical protein